jgi:hypothetical protein
VFTSDNKITVRWFLLSERRGLVMSCHNRPCLSILIEGEVHTMQQYGDNVIPVIPVEHQPHTPESPFCYDDSCACHEDLELVRSVDDQYLDGLLTTSEATRVVQGKQI